MKKPTIRDIARIAEVSETTVSNVINDRAGRVSDEIKAKVKQIISQLSYKTNYAAKALRRKKSNLIGIVIPQTESSNKIKLENSFYSQIVSELEFLFRQAGYQIILSGLNEMMDDVDFFNKWDIEAAIIVGTYKDTLYSNISKNDIPVVLVDSYIDNSRFYSINTDDEKGGYLAGKYLVGKGHRDIAFISGQLKSSGVMRKRFDGFRKALSESHIHPVVYEGSVSFEWGEQAGGMISPEKCSAVFSAADIISIGFLKALQKRRIFVPDDISIISFDNTILAEFPYPPLTCIDQDIPGKACRIFELVSKLIKKESVPRNQWLEISIRERGSVLDK